MIIRGVHKTVQSPDEETLDELIGKNYDYARYHHIKENPDEEYRVNVNKGLSEFDIGVYNHRKDLSDSIIHVFTWHSINHKKTIWVGQTKTMENEVIDALRFKKGVVF